MYNFTQWKMGLKLRVDKYLKLLEICLIKKPTKACFTYRCEKAKFM